MTLNDTVTTILFLLVVYALYRAIDAHIKLRRIERQLERKLNARYGGLTSTRPQNPQSYAREEYD